MVKQRRKRRRCGASILQPSEDQSSSCESEIGEDHETLSNQGSRDSKNNDKDDEKLPPLYEDPKSEVICMDLSQGSEGSEPQIISMSHDLKSAAICQDSQQRSEGLDAQTNSAISQDSQQRNEGLDAQTNSAISQDSQQRNEGLDAQTNSDSYDQPVDSDVLPPLYETTSSNLSGENGSSVDCSKDKVEEDTNVAESPDGSHTALNDAPNNTRKRKLSENVIDIFENAITRCIENENSDDGENKSNQKTIQKKGKSAIIESLLDSDQIIPEKNNRDNIIVEKASQKVRNVSVIDLSGDSHCHGDGPSNYSLPPTVILGPNREPVYKNMVTIVANPQPGKSMHHPRQVSLLQPPDEAAVAAAKLMTDMAGSRSTTSVPHSNIAETQVTDSGYGYCSSGDAQFAHKNSQYPVNFASQAMFGQTAWQPTDFQQPEQYSHWEGNMAGFDGNNNVINREGYHVGTQGQYPGMAVPMRVVGNTGPNGLPMVYDDDAQMPPDYRNIHPYPMGMPLDYSASKDCRDVESQEDDLNGETVQRKQVRKFVIIDPKPVNVDDGSPAKRSRKTKTSDPPELVADYEEIVKNLFVHAPPQKTVLVQPRFLSKYRGPRGSDIDPTKVKSISHRGLIKKYIDYLVMENEYITEISKAVSLPMDNCVMDDPYLMDVIRIKIPFPTPKYMQFLKDFYPAIQVDWRALNHQLDQYRSSGDGARRFQSYYLDNRAVPVLLGEAFYFFQRESDRKSMETCQPQSAA